MAILNRLSQTSRGLLLLLLAAGLILIIWLLIVPAYKNASEVRGDLQQAQQQYQARLNTLKQVEELRANYQANRGRLERLEQALPNAPQLPQLLANLERLALQGGMHVEQIRITEETPQTSAEASSQAASNLSVVPSSELVNMKVDFVVSGTYEAFPAFLEIVERNLRLLEVEGLATEQGGGQALASFRLGIETFYQK